MILSPPTHPTYQRACPNIIAVVVDSAIFSRVGKATLRHVIKHKHILITIQTCPEVAHSNHVIAIHIVSQTSCIPPETFLQACLATYMYVFDNYPNVRFFGMSLNR